MPDRVSRDQADVAVLCKHLRFAGVMIVTLAEGEISEPHVGLEGTMNALFLKDLAAKTRRGLRGRMEARQSGGERAHAQQAAVIRDCQGLVEQIDREREAAKQWTQATSSIKCRACARITPYDTTRAIPARCRATAFRYPCPSTRVPQFQHSHHWRSWRGVPPPGPGRLREPVRATRPFFFGEPGRRGSGRCVEDAGKALNHRRTP